MTTYNFDFEDIKFRDGSLTAALLDKDDDPNRVIERGDKASVRVEWTLRTDDAWILNGTLWHIHVFAESIGPGPELDLIHHDLPAMPPTSQVGDDLFWKVEIPIDTKNGIPQDGAYKMVVVLTHTALVNGVQRKTRLAGFSEISMVQFYTHET